MGKYFGTDGIRGIAFEQLSEKIAFRIGQGLKEAIGYNSVVIGFDTRESSPMLAHMIAAGALSTGMDVLFAGVCSTPMLAYYSSIKEMTGIMITASHNPYTDNGIKVFNKGYKSTDGEESVLEEYIKNPRIKISNFGSFRIVDNFNEEYLKLYTNIEVNTDLSIMYDSANGGNYQIAKHMFDFYRLDAIQIGNQPNGLNINKECGSTHMSSIQNFLRETNRDIGFSFDGDGDRVIACDQNRIYDGDQIIYMIAKYLKQENLLKNNIVVVTKMTNPGILKAYNNLKIDVILTDVGDKYVSLALNEHDAVIGGESSGHIILKHLLHTGDGLLAALYLLQVISYSKKNIESLSNDYELYPYQTTNIKNISKNILEDNDTTTFLENVKMSLGTDSLFIVRASGTEPLIRITISHQDEQVVIEATQKVVNFLKEKEKTHE